MVERTADAAQSPGREAWRMFVRNKTALFGLVLLIVILALTLYGAFIYSGDPYDVVWAPHEPPLVSEGFPLGTDYLGRDLVAGMLKGGFTEFFQVLPALLFAMVLVTLFSPSLWTIAFAIGVVSWPQTARLTRAEFLKIKELEYVRSSATTAIKFLMHGGR